MSSDAIDRFVRALGSTGQRRITLDKLRVVFAAACPELAEQPDRRTHLAQLIQQAAGHDELMLPRGASAWDRAGASALPNFVILNAERSVRDPAVPAGYAWHPLLAFAASERNALRLAALTTVNEWLKTGPDLDCVVPIKERSLEIFDDEKRLDRLRTGGELFNGQLKLSALACRICPVPLPYEAGPPAATGRPVLVIENNDTWASFCAWNRQAARFSAVAYAGGGHAKGMSYDELFLDTLLERGATRELLYFGDIDPAGIRIAAGAAQRRASWGGSALVPAVPLYDWLVRHGKRVSLKASEQVTAEELTWLPAGIRDSVTQLFAARQRIPQESLGTRVLRAAGAELLRAV